MGILDGQYCPRVQEGDGDVPFPGRENAKDQLSPGRGTSEQKKYDFSEKGTKIIPFTVWKTA